MGVFRGVYIYNGSLNGVYVYMGAPHTKQFEFAPVYPIPPMFILFPTAASHFYKVYKLVVIVKVLYNCISHNLIKNNQPNY